MNVNSVERALKTVNLEEPDRVPFAPYMSFFNKKGCGITSREFLFNPTKAEECSRIIFEKLNGFDIYAPGTMAGWPLSDHFMGVLYLDWKLPGVDLPDDDTTQIMERQIGKDIYHTIVEKGIPHYKLRIDEEVESRFGIDIKSYQATVHQTLLNTEEWAKSKQIMIISGGNIWHPVDLLSYLRGVKEWLVDCVYELDDMFIAADKIFDSYLNVYKTFRRKNPDISILASVGSHRTSASFISPTQFERIGFPFFERAVNEILKDYHIVILHLDGNWVPFLDYFRELPKRRCILQLDHLSDFIKAKKIIGDYHCLMGNISPSLLSVGTPTEVEKACKRLIEGCKEGGGFILSSSCEIPPETPFENVITMKKAVMKYGVYD